MSERVSIGGEHELARLGRQFNSMADAVEENIQKLKDDLLKYRITYDRWYLESDLHNSGAVTDIIEKLKNGEDFATLAKEHSKDEATASNGGSLGKINDGDATDEVLTALRNMKTPIYSL